MQHLRWYPRVCASARACRRQCPPASRFKSVSVVRAKQEGRFDAEASRGMQMEASRYLAQLLDAKNPEEKAKELAEHLTESFFVMATTYLEMARKEKQTAVVDRLEEVIKIAMKAKNATLRPEIRLLNELLDAASATERSQVLKGESTEETLTMNGEYFFQLLERMTQDVRRQPDSARKDELIARLNAILSEASSALAD